MRIAVSSNLFPPVVSGTASYTWDVCKALSDFGHEVLLMIPDGLGDGVWEKNEPDGVSETLLLPSWKVPATSIMHGFTQLRSTMLPGNLARVSRFLWDKKVEYVFQQSHVFDTALHTRITCARLGIPRSVAHHTNIIHPNPVVCGGLRIGERLVLGNACLKSDDLWLCPDDFTLEYCRQRFPRMKRANVPYGVSPFPQCTDKETIERATAMRREHEPLIASIGHVTGCRDRVDLIQALRIVRERYPRVGLVVIGDLQVRYPVEQVNKLGMQDNVHFLGRLPRDRVRPYLEAADLEAHWFNDDSTFGMATLEAMATGSCCLSSCPEDCYGSGMFKEGVDYLRIRSKDPNYIAQCILETVSKPGFARSIGDHAARLIRDRLSWNAVARDLSRVFEDHIRDYRREKGVISRR